MDTQPRRRFSHIPFRVLVIGTENAAILQGVCGTMEDYKYLCYKERPKERVRGPIFLCEFDLTLDHGDQVKLDPSMDVSDSRPCYQMPLSYSQRGEHTIDDELVLVDIRGYVFYDYVFHDSRGIESGGTEGLGILQDFVRQRCGERLLLDRLHAIWFVCSSVHDCDN